MIKYSVNGIVLLYFVVVFFFLNIYCFSCNAEIVPCSISTVCSNRIFKWGQKKMHPIVPLMGSQRTSIQRKTNKKSFHNLSFWQDFYRIDDHISKCVGKHNVAALVIGTENHCMKTYKLSSWENGPNQSYIYIIYDWKKKNWKPYHFIVPLYWTKFKEPKDMEKNRWKI